MQIFRFETSERLAVGIEQAWDFFSNPANLSAITPRSLGFEIKAPLPPAMYAGLIIVYRVRPLLGIPVTWVTEITQVRQPFFFVDEQRFGPYRFWHHEHGFKAIDGGTEVSDTVHYALWPPFSALVNRFVVMRSIERIFKFRRAVLRDRFGAVG